MEKPRTYNEFRPAKPATPEIKARLHDLRHELRNESISYGELAELQSLSDYIEPDDVELLEAAGVPEFDDDNTKGV